MLALIVVVPMLGAAVAALLPAGRLPWLWATAVSWFMLYAAAVLAAQSMDLGVLSYWMGGWQPPIGIEYRLDPANALVALLVSLLAAVVLPYAGRSLASEVPEEKSPYLYAAVLLFLAGQVGIAVTGDAFNVFVFLEISSLATYTLIGLGRDRRALTASFSYLIMGTVGATFFLIGVGLLYAMTGTLNMADLAARIPEVAETRTVHTAFAFIVVGVCLKLALFPLHLWLPNAYTYAPSAVTALMAATATKVAIYVLIRFIYTVFGPDFAFGDMPTVYLLVPLAVVGLLSTSVVAIGQSNIKRMLAYSSVAQIGYMVLGIGMATTAGLTAALLHVFNHALMKGALFMALGCIALRFGTTQLDGFRGLGRRMPFTMAAFVVGGLSLIGVPLTVGFISKWYLVSAAIELGWWPIVAVIIVGSLLAVIYIWRVVETAYLQSADDETRCEAPLSMLVPTWVLIGATIWFGIDTRVTVGLAERAAAMLTGAAP
ncbi:MAG TPA: monovalent cation/H+ antiporter subunit D family protein [Gammaproteobacteria bacterium]|nr:monovalent cation/H+ antiporter subunit D family protein [Gammaproteobacteria bacterium]